MNWQKTLAQGFSNADALLAFLGLPANLACNISEQQFKTRIPLGFAKRMRVGDPQDPLLLQVLASAHEQTAHADFIASPLQEKAVNPLPGLLHKYHGRVLLTLVGACAVNCRYCFRRHFPYADNNPGRDGWQAIFNYIRSDPTISEVILSGGDPLLANDALLSEFISQLVTIKHVTILRFHTRIPIVLPERIDASFLAFLNTIPLKKVMVLHCNHSQEINEDVAYACKQLLAANCVLLNQSVLLRQINNDATVLAELSHRLFACHVLPYYLHLLDKVTGSVHFDIPQKEALAIYRQLQCLLPGYLLPRLVREVVGASSKALVSLD